VVLVPSADAVYTLDYRDVVDAHFEADADVTMVTSKVDEDAGRFGVVTVAVDRRVTGFAYKPDDPQSDLVTTEVFAYLPAALLDALSSSTAGVPSSPAFPVETHGQWASNSRGAVAPCPCVVRGRTS